MMGTCPSQSLELQLVITHTKLVHMLLYYTVCLLSVDYHTYVL